MQITRTCFRAAVLLFLAAIPLAGCGNRGVRDEGTAKQPAARPTIVFMTDFGTANDAVAICRAVIVGIVPDVRIMDITTLAGPVVQTLVRLTPTTATIDAKGITGQVMGLDDPFGSLITDIQGDDFKKLGYSLGEKVPVKIAQKSYAFPYGKAFMDVPVGESLLYIDSRGRLGFAVNQGNFSRIYKITPPVSVFIARKKG
jgi:S-adenosylmethionine hydrolase